MSTMPIDKRRQRNVRALSAFIAASLLLLAGCQAIAPTAQPDTSGNTVPAVAESHAGHVTVEIPEVTIEVSADSVIMPAEIPAGPVNFQVTVAEDGAGSPMLARFVEGKGLEELGAALAAMETAGPGALFDVVSLYGGGEGPSMQDYTLQLQPGEHVAVVLGEGMPILHPFTVLLNEIEPEAPVAEVEAKMVDFAFELPESIPAGEHVWRFVNDGGQWHETVVFEAKEGMSVDELIAAASSEAPSEDAPAMAFVWTPASQGEEGWATIDLPAGDYIVICFLPNLAGDMSPHFAHGMVRTLHVE